MCQVTQAQAPATVTTITCQECKEGGVLNYYRTNPLTGLVTRRRAWCRRCYETICHRAVRRRAAGQEKAKPRRDQSLMQDIPDGRSPVTAGVVYDGHTSERGSVVDILDRITTRQDEALVGGGV